jgi:hypothetical protein
MRELTKNISTNGDWPLQGEVFVDLFEKYVDFAVEDAATIEYVIRCAEYLNSFDDELIEALCAACIRYCNGFLTIVGDAPKHFALPRDVLKLISPSLLIVPNIEDLDEPVVHMELNCDWEIEHGMEWIIRGKNILYVGSFNGQDPWAEYLEKKSWNYA